MEIVEAQLILNLTYREKMDDPDMMLTLDGMMEMIKDALHDCPYDVRLVEVNSRVIKV